MTLLSLSLIRITSGCEEIHWFMAFQRQGDGLNPMFPNTGKLKDTSELIETANSSSFKSEPSTLVCVVFVLFQIPSASSDFLHISDCSFFLQQEDRNVRKVSASR